MASDGFLPRRDPSFFSPCRGGPAPAYRDPYLRGPHGPANANGTAPRVPWDPTSKIQLTGGALTASARPAQRPINPVSRIGVTSRVLNWDNPYGVGDISSDPCSSAASVYQLQPWQPGYLEPRMNDSTDGTRYQRRYYYQPEFWSPAAGPYGGPYAPVAAACGGYCGPADADFGGPLYSGGPFYRGPQRSAETLCAPPAELAAAPGRAYRTGAARRETMRSRGNTRRVARADECLTGEGCGLGSTWIDPRYEPGPVAMYPQQYAGAAPDAVWAHGGHAGGPTFGALVPSAFRPANPAWSRYVRGRGDCHLIAPDR